MATNITTVFMEKEEEKGIFLTVLQHKLNKQCLCKCTQILKYIFFHVNCYSSELQSLLLLISIS